VKHNQDVLAQIPGLLCLALAKAFARRHHQNNGNDAPGDPKHGQERAQFVCPQGTKHIANEIAQDHRRLDAERG
jgi:hypothetical protein